MSNLVLKDSKKIRLSLRDIRGRGDKWAAKFDFFEEKIGEEFKSWLEERNGDLPTIYDLKLRVFPKIKILSDSYLSQILAAWFYFVAKGYHPKYKVIDDVFLAPK